ncbi:MAG: metal ABC transporter substrate-binding protein [Micrococcales bacterium]|nr:MAG: metal ABC transporter substrate-binding protein [Micrococcales bacterium]
MKRIAGLAAGAVAVLAAAGLTGCGASDSGAGDGPVAVATTTMLGSVLDQITECAGAESATLMPPGADPHEFAPSSAQVAEMAHAELVVANGLGLEGGLSDALANVAADGVQLYEAAPDLDPLPLDAEHDHGRLDPHVWLDVARMATAARKIGGKLTEVTGEDFYTACGREVAEDLTGTDGEIRQILGEVPADQRVIVTDHMAFGYFAQAYDFEVAGTVVPGGSTEGQPSSAELAELVGVLDAEGVNAIFSNTATNSQLVDAVAAETGRAVSVVSLHVGSVGPAGSDADTYQGMMIANARSVADALGS